MCPQTVQHVQKTPAEGEGDLARCTVLLHDREVRLPVSAQSLDGFRAWAKSADCPERGRFSFVDHELFIDISPEEYEAHGQVKAEVSRVVMNLVLKLDLGKFFPHRTLVSNEAAGLSTQPDAAFASWESFRSGRVRLVAPGEEPDRYLELEDAPDWVLEVVSASSVRKDTQQLLEAYHRAGVPEYWLIDARGREIDFQVLHHQSGGYVSAPSRGKWRRSAVFGRRFHLDRRRDRLGLWQYTLQVKSA